MIVKNKAFFSAVLGSLVAVLVIGLAVQPASAAAQSAPSQLETLAKSDTVAAAASSKKLKASDTKVSLKEGEAETIKLKYDGKNLSASKATWRTSNSSVATVSNGKITAKASGTATITAEYKSKKVEIQVTVSSSTLKANRTSISLKEGVSEDVKLTFNSKKLSASKATWTTSNSSVATVKNGKITAKATGSATITAKYSGKEVKINVTVTASTLTASTTKATVNKGKQKEVTLKFNGKKLSASKATWTTSDSSIATVSKGKIKGKKKGTATITAKYSGKEVKITVTVK